MRIPNLILLLALAALVAACGSSTGDNNNQGTVVTPTPTTASQPTPTPTPSRFKTGQTVHIGDWEVTVNSAKASNGANGVTTDAGKKFIIINVTLKNVGAAAQNVSSIGNFKLKQSDGTQGTNDSFSSTLLGGSPAPDGSVDPNDKLRGDLVFTVAKAEKQLAFTFLPDMLNGSKAAVWDLTV